MDSTDVLTALRNELVTAGLVRKPSIAGALTPVHVEPEAAPAPLEREAPEDDPELVVSIELDTELGAGPFMADRPRVVVLVRYRSRLTAGIIRARRLDAAIKARIAGRPDGGLGWVMDDGGAHPVLVLSSTVYGGLGKVGVTEDRVTDQNARYLFEVKAA